MYVCMYVCMSGNIVLSPSQFLEIIKSIQYRKLDMQRNELLGEQIALEIHKEFA